MDWLQESSEALSDIEIWGFEQKVYQWSHLQGYFARNGIPLAESEDDVKKVNVKKGHKKVKKDKKIDKGKGKGKARDSDEESESSPRKKSDSSHKK